MNLTLTLTASTLAAISKVLDCRKAVMLSGHSDYIDRQLDTAAVRALDLLMQDNAATTGLTAMLAEVERVTADEDGEFAAQREQLAIEADRLNDLNKPGRAHLKQTLNAVRLEQQFNQVFVA